MMMMTIMMMTMMMTRIMKKMMLMINGAWPLGCSEKNFFLVDKKRLNHKCQYVWRAQISIFRFLSQKMAVFRHFLVLEGDIVEGILKIIFGDHF